MSTMAVLDKTVCLQLSVSLWSGRRRLRAEDLGSAADSLPPGDLASLGSLKLCDPKKLARLGNIKRAAERDLRRVCVQFLGGYATDADNVSALVTKLASHQQRFENEARAFANGLQQEIDGWIALHPQWKTVIERALPNAARVAGSFQFGYRVFRVGPATDDPRAHVNGGLAEATTGLAGRLFAEIEAEAREAWERSYLGKDAVSQKALRPILSIQRKLEALRYLDARCQPIIDRITVVLGTLPKHGRIETANLSAVIGLLHLLGDAAAMRVQGAAVLKGNGASADAAHETDASAADATNGSAHENGGGDPIDSTVPPNGNGRATPERTSDALWF